MARVLLLVHVEESFRSSFPPGYAARIRKFARRKDRVIHCTSHVGDDRPISEILDVVGEEIDWAWGYEPESFDGDEKGHVIRTYGNHHEWTWVPPELRRWKPGDHSITLGGGCDAECLDDMRAVLRHLGLPYREARSLVY